MGVLRVPPATAILVFSWMEDDAVKKALLLEDETGGG